MAAANLTESLREEVSCSICLDYFTDPVSLDCGHNFCRSCITQSWQGKDTNFPCPQCSETSQHRNLRANRQLVNVTEMVKKLSQCTKEENLCQEHEERLKLFCEKDQKAICVICRESRDHRSHTVIPIKEAVQEYKENIIIHLEPLRKQLEDLQKFKSDEEERAEELRSETEIQRQKIESEFEELHQFLNEKKQIILSKLEDEENMILQRMDENVTRLEEEMDSLKQLISEMEDKSQQPAIELLKDMKNALSRCRKMKFPEPKAVSTDLVMGFLLSYPQQLKKLVKGYRDWYMEYGRYAVDVTLDPGTAHPVLVLSEDQKSVRRGIRRQDLPDNPERFDTGVCVLGCQGFTSGRHYWEVEVEVGVGDGNWILGVCKESVRRKGVIRWSPEGGYWIVQGLGDKYIALTSPEIHLSLSERPWAVGIFLDYEAGKVSFYNADNRSHLFTFTDTFTGTIRPFLWVYFGEPLRIRRVPAWD
uniref:RING-type E3 ubiquitin transferase n=1 Tax=Geotrypetes seraphini TaxID=260995 RepID=A0A6P8Q197_GEOSA|nr:E3 ubiquitin-protein ligase TRIM39-like [Geotrypetes seraphini]